MNKKQSNSIMEMFNLPSYIKGKTFAEASKLINDKFDGQTDPDSKATLQELQGRLQQAQEYIKEQSSNPSEQKGEMPSQEGTSMDTNDHFLGGIMSMLGGAGGASAAGAAGAAGGIGAGAAGAAGGAASGPGIAGIAGMAGTAMELGKQAFGPTGVDTTGMVDPGKQIKPGMSALGGAAKGAMAGSSLGPVGAVVGGVLGGAAGFIGGKKKAADQQEAQVNSTYIQAKANNNKYEFGGFMDETDPNKLIGMLASNQGNTEPMADTFAPYMSSAQPYMSNDYNPQKEQFKSMGLDDASLDADEDAYRLESMQKFTDSLPDPNKGLVDESKKIAKNSSKLIEESTPSKSGYNPAELLRYAPALTDAYQLATLKKPDQVSRGRLGNKYDPQQVDERQLQNTVQEGVATNRDAILGSSGGSASTARANLLGLSLQGTKAMSNAMIQAGGENRADNRQGQQFNLGIDQTNLQQANAEQLANEQNQGAYDTQKSQLISQLGSNMGEIGKEELFKNIQNLWEWTLILLEDT